MSAEILRLFPDGLSNKRVEKCPPRHNPPCRFVPMKPAKVEEGEYTTKDTITVELGVKTTAKVKPFVFTNVEGLLKMQVHHEYIIQQQESKNKHKTLLGLQADAHAKLLLIPSNSNDAVEIKATERLTELIDTLTRRADALIKKAFVLYQQMSSSTLRDEWDEIVLEHCFKAPWTDAKGVVSITARGQSWDALSQCQMLHLLTVCDQDAAEQHKLYINSTLIKPAKLSIKPYYNRLKEMDGFAPRMPCLADDPDCPAGIPRHNTSLTDFKTCCHLMRVMHPIAEAEYYCLHDKVPTDPKKLVAALVRIEKKLKITMGDKIAQTMDDSRTNSGDVESIRNPKDRRKAGPRDGRNRAVDKTGEHGAKTVPRKPKRASNGKHCTLCATFGGAEHTHDTSGCNKWLAGGKAHPDWVTKQHNYLKKDESMKMLMAQQTELNKSLMDKLEKISKKSKRKRKSRRNRDDSSDSSDSD